MSDQFWGTAPLKAADDIFNFVLETFDLGLEEGWIPDNRNAPNGLESCLYVLDHAAKPVAFVTFFRLPEPHDSITWVDLLWVAEDRRHQGLGGTLLDRVAAIAKKAGGGRLELGTGIDNAPMRGLAKAWGLKEIGTYYRSEL